MLAPLVALAACGHQPNGQDQAVAVSGAPGGPVGYPSRAAEAADFETAAGKLAPDEGRDLGVPPRPTAAEEPAARTPVRVGHDALDSYRRPPGRGAENGQVSVASYGRDSYARYGELPHLGPDPDGPLGSIDDGRLYVDHDRPDNGSAYFDRVTGNMWLEPSDSGLLIGLDMPL